MTDIFLIQLRTYIIVEYSLQAVSLAKIRRETKMKKNNFSASKKRIFYSFCLEKVLNGIVVNLPNLNGGSLKNTSIVTK